MIVDRLPPVDVDHALAGLSPAPARARPMTQVRPIGDRVLVILDRKPGVSAGGVIYAPMLQDQPVTGYVAAVGTRCTCLEVGERVVFGKWNGERADAAWTREQGFDPGELYFMRPLSRGKDAHVMILGIVASTCSKRAGATSTT